MTDRARPLAWAGPALAALAFAAVFAAFAWQLSAYRRSVRSWSEQDLQSRAELAAVVLAEPLRTLDFKAIHAFGDQCRADGLRLRICHGGRFSASEDAAAGKSGFYDTSGGADSGCTFRTSRSGEFTVGVGRSASQVMRPFATATAVIALSGLLGVAAVVLFFAAVWRQRVSIRSLARMERFRREFVADVSHEIKTPLTGILGAADMMDARDPLPAMVKKEAARLNALVQQILDLSRLERDGEVLRLADIDLADLVRETVERFAPQAKAAGVDLSVGDGSAKSLVAACDGDLLSRALACLVENALRHSGSPKVRVSCGANGRTSWLAVEDEGRGVPAAEAERIFERFRRLDESRSAETGGAGLGLAIVRRIARLHGGDAFCEPVRPCGARFVVTIRGMKA